jgi:hypothetical protein
MKAIKTSKKLIKEKYQISIRGIAEETLLLGHLGRLRFVESQTEFSSAPFMTYSTTD